MKGRKRRYEEGVFPFVAIPHGSAPPWADLPLTCPKCGAKCKLRDSDPPGLTYISHCGRSWLRGPVPFRSLKEADEAARATTE